MAKAPTLIDLIYRRTFRTETNPGWRSNAEMRHALQSAHRFIADDSMAAFMAELSNESFIKTTEPITIRLAVRIADSLRVQARLPHESIWIEYPLRVYQKRSCEIRGVTNNQPELQPSREGWLIQQHPKIDTACIMHLFTSHEHVQDDGNDAWTFPFAFAWSCDDNPLPWQQTIKTSLSANAPSEYLVGIPSYVRDNVGCVRSPLIIDPRQDYDIAYRTLFTEWIAIIRRVWALLATIDNLPITFGNVRQSKGFLARGQIRKYLDHRTITLNVPPKTNTRVLARKVIAIAHRKRHEVRAHWRDDWRNRPSTTCNPHLWECVDDNADTIRCELCGGRQFYIHKHERGDAALGYTTHDYRLVHEES